MPASGAPEPRVRRIHSTTKTLTLDSLTPFEAKARMTRDITTAKPFGLWYWIGTEWLEWVASNQDNWLSERYLKHYAIELDTSQMLVLTSPDAIRKFHADFNVRKYQEFLELPTNDQWILDRVGVNWDAVAEQYSGIEINPYRYDDLRYDIQYLWYYGWDCSSGCIWRPEIIRALTPIEIPAWTRHG